MNSTEPTIQISETSTQKKLNSIEVNSNKEEVRSTIAAQIIASRGFLLRAGNKTLRGLTLSGDRFLFERLSRGMGHVQGVEIEYDCAEQNQAVFASALKHKPPFCRLSLCDIEDLMFNRPEYDSCGIGTSYIAPDDPVAATHEDFRLDHQQPRFDNRYSFAWLDYCCMVNRAILTSLAQFVAARPHDNKTFLVYATFSVGQGRVGKDGTGGMMKLPIYDPKASQSSIIDANLVHSLQKIAGISKKHIKRVLAITYSGGQDYHTPMYTVGFAIGPHAARIATITADMMRTKGDFSNYHFRLFQRRMAVAHGKNYRLADRRFRIIKRDNNHSGNKSVGTREAKDAVVALASDLLSAKMSISELNRTVFNMLKSKHPSLSLQSVSSTITTRVTHRDSWVHNKTAA